MADAKHLRAKFSHVASLAELEEIAAEHLAHVALRAEAGPVIDSAHGVIAAV
jgi:hypothetical protein